jgi:hypothetical protein
MLAILASAPAGAILFRVRGGLIPGIGTSVSRLIWSAGMAGFAVAAHGDWWLASLAPVFFLGCIFGFPACIDLGRNEGEFRKDFALLTLRGLWFTLPCAPLLWWFGHGWWFGFVGLAMAVLYEAGWRLPDFKYLRQTEKGEALFGALCGVALCFV